MSGLFGPYPNGSGSDSPSTALPAVSPLPGIIKRTAGQNLSPFRAVYVHNDGHLYLADFATYPQCAPLICGITPGPDGYQIGSAGFARIVGELDMPGFNFIDGPIFVGPQGIPIQTLPTVGPVVMLGVAIGPSTMKVEVQAFQSSSAPVVSSGSSDDAVVFNQSVAKLSWTITHSFPRIPNVAVFDSAGRQVFPDITVINSATIQIDFSGASDGTAILT